MTRSVNWIYFHQSLTLFSTIFAGNKIKIKIIVHLNEQIFVDKEWYGIYAEVNIRVQMTRLWSTLEGVCFNPDGIVEWWNVGNQKWIMVWFYNLIRAILIKTDLIPLNPDLQYSNVPVFHYSTAYVCGTANFLWSSPEDQVFNAIIKLIMVNG